MELKRAIRISSDNPEFYFKLAGIHEMIGEFVDAAEAYENFLKHCPEYENINKIKTKIQSLKELAKESKKDISPETITETKGKNVFNAIKSLFK